MWHIFFLFSIQRYTTKKQGYPSVLKTAGIAPESAGIGSKLLSLCFKPPRFECRNRITGPIPALFKSTGIGPSTFQTMFQRFYLCWDSLYENVYITYTSVFTTCANAFESAGKKNARIGILTLCQRFLGLSQRFWKRWDSPIFL